MADAWRLIVDGAGDAAWNMAVDEAMLDGYTGCAPDRPPTLRLYGWSPPALSIGRSQPYDDPAAASDLLMRGFGLVRRPTGGGSVLHELERTYAVAGTRRWAPFDGELTATYRRIASALCRALSDLGVEVTPVGPESAERFRPTGGSPRDCFRTISAYEIVYRGTKLVGSAQLRRREAVLQHGAIPIKPPLEVDAQRLDTALIRAFGDELGVRFELGGLDPDERLRAVSLRASRYLSREWTLRGRVASVAGA